MTQELPPSARTIQPSSGKVLAGLAFLFCLPSLGVSLFFYILMGAHHSLWIPAFGVNVEGGESRGLLAFLLNLLPVMAFGGLLASLDLIRNYWKERLPALNGWSKEKALWLTLPFFVLGPLYYHLIILTAALKAPGHCVSTPAGGVQMNFGAIKRSELTDAACEEMLKCYRDGGCDAYWRKDDIYKFVWKKVIVNSTVNTVCYVLRLKIGQVESTPAGQ